MKAKRAPAAESAPSELSLELHLAHVTPGRSRFVLDVLYRDEEACEVVEGRLRLENFILAVKARPQSGSLVIEYNRNHKLDVEHLRTCIEEALDNPDQYKFKELAASTSTQALLDQDLQLVYCSQSASSLLKELRVDSTQGLATSEVNDRRLLYGSNQMEEVKPTSHWTLFSRQFANSQTWLLAGSAGLSLVTGGLFDVAMIGGVILMNGYVGYLSEARADEVISSIGHIDPQDVRVIRDGVFCTILDHQLVVGDIVSLSHGVVPADIRLIESKGLMVDESPLTGESMPVAKHHNAIERNQLHTISDRRNLLFRGTIVTSGQGLGVVIATGENTEIGRVRRLVATAEQLESPLQKDLEDIGRQTIMISGAICGGVFLLGVMRGRSLLQMMQTSISLAVAAVPEGLPTIGTTTMALGVGNLKKRNILVRRLNVLEALGSVEVLCLDKTGTLTMNEMIAEEGYFGNEYWHCSQIGEAKKTRSKDYGATVILPSRKWSLIAALCTDCERIKNPDGPGQRWSGSSTEKAIIEVAERMGMDVESLQKDLPRFKVSYRTESRQYMVTYHNLRDQDRNLAAVKGNPEQLLEMSAWMLDQGVLRELTDEMRQKLRDQNRELAKKGLRVLGFAYAEGQGMTSIQDEPLVWLGAVGLMDPPREGMSELIEKFHRAGIKTIMMTGDQTDTAKAVGKALGFNGNGGKLKSFDARDLKDLSLEAIADLAEEVQVFSRVSPTDKLRIVQALQQRGRIVAMTGDGINDSPALKAAHVGIAMGFQGTSAARESADIVLKDDNLEVLYFAIEQGRSVRTNLRKSIRYLLGTNMSEIMVMFLAIAAGRESPLNSMQLLWINLLTDVLPGLALALDPPAEDIMREPPADPTEPLLSNFAKLRLLVEAGFLSAGSLIAFETLSRQGKPGTNTTAAFVSLTTSQILHTLSASADSQGLIRGKFPRNKRIYGAMGVAGSTIAMGVISPWFRRLLGNEALTAGQLGQSLAHGVWPVMLLELLKLGRR
jgi:Ca2+-transporting ATPase